MPVLRAKSIKIMLSAIKKYIYERQMYQFNEVNGGFIIDSKTGKRVRSGLPSDYCKAVAIRRYHAIDEAINNLEHHANSEHTFITPKGNVIYYTIPNDTGRARIFYTVLTNRRSSQIKALAVTLPGMPIERILSTFELFNRLRSKRTRRYLEREEPNTFDVRTYVKYHR